MRIYIASSWKNQHAIELLTDKLRNAGHTVLSWIENNYGEDHGPDAVDFEKWVNTDASDRSFDYDTDGAINCDLFIYVGPAGKDAAAECGMCYATRFAGKRIPMLALWAKGEDFGLMRKMFSGWYKRYQELLDAIKAYDNNAEPIEG